MLMQTASKIPYHPQQCPQCQHYYQEIHRCRAFAVDSVPRPILAVFQGEVEENCLAFKALISAPNTAVPVPVSVTPQEVDAREIPLEPAYKGLCPACQRELAAIQDFCPHCGVRLSTSMQGYCSTCRAIVVAAENGCCGLCGGELIDAHLVSTVLKAAPEAETKREIPSAQEARVHCRKCKIENPPTQVKCKQCGTNLIPSEGIATRIGYLISGMLGAAVFGYLAYLSATNPENAPMICQSPVEAGVISIFSALFGVVMALRRTPAYMQYANRAERHIDLNLPQALADINEAIALAPEKERAELISKRARIFEKLGMEREALRDQLEYTLEPGAYRLGSTLTSFIGGNSDVYASGRGKSERTQLLKSGKVKALGYCTRCKQVVELTIELRCPDHRSRRPKDVRFVLADEVETGRQEVYAEKTKRRPLSGKKRLRLAAVLLTLPVAYLVINMLNNTPQDQILPAETQTLVAQPTIFPMTFNEQGVSYLYPSDWLLIGDDEVDTLVNTSLEGIGEYEYIGGVYTGGVENCLDCAQVVLVVLSAPVTGPLTEEQYQQQKVEAQDRMGSRLLLHQKIEVSGVPVIESVHVGLSEETQLWELMWLEPGESTIYMLSCSAHVDNYERFEPVFAQALDNLALGDVAQLVMPTIQPVLIIEETPVPLVLGSINQSSVRVRSGPGTTFNVVGGLSRGAEVEVLGRNEAADWVQIDDQEGLSGWVLIDLITLSVPVESLPVVEAMP